MLKHSRRSSRSSIDKPRIRYRSLVFNKTFPISPFPVLLLSLLYPFYPSYPFHFSTLASLSLFRQVLRQGGRPSPYGRCTNLLRAFCCRCSCSSMSWSRCCWCWCCCYRPPLSPFVFSPLDPGAGRITTAGGRSAIQRRDAIIAAVVVHVIAEFVGNGSRVGGGSGAESGAWAEVERTVEELGAYSRNKFAWPLRSFISPCRMPIWTMVPPSIAFLPVLLFVLFVESPYHPAQTPTYSKFPTR